MEGPKPISEMSREDLRVFNVPHDSGYTSLVGCVSGREGYIHKHVSFNHFAQEATKVPENAEPQDTPGEGWAKILFDPNKRRLVASISEFPAEAVPKGKAYKIEDNGGMAFVCYVYEGGPGQGVSSVSVWRKPRAGYIDEDEWLLHWNDLEKTRLYYQEQVCVFENVAQVHLGVDNVANQHGNSILLRLSGGAEDGGTSEDSEKYVFVGWEIYSFRLKRQDRVTEYFSRMGRSSVPYPVALTERIVVFMLDSVWVPRTEIAPYIDNEQYCRGDDKIAWDDAYYVFCDSKLNGADQNAVKLTVTPLDDHDMLVARDVFA